MIKRYIEYRTVADCSIRKRKMRYDCSHAVIRSYRREKNLIYVKDSVYCGANKEETLVSIEKIKTITPFEFWNLGVVSYGDKNASL